MEAVNFWETGPLSPESRVIYGHSADEIASDKVASEIETMINGERSQYNTYFRKVDGIVCYDSLQVDKEAFCWQLIEAIYMQGPFPIVNREVTLLAMIRLRELCQLALEQFLKLASNKTRAIALETLEQVDSLIESIYKMSFETRPIIDWFQTERIRIAPGDIDVVLFATKRKFEDLETVLKVYVSDDLIQVKEKPHADSNIYK